MTHPTSRGRLELSGAAVSDPPLIDPAYLSTEHDRRLARRALQVARAVGHQGALAGWQTEEIILASHAAATRSSMLSYNER